MKRYITLSLFVFLSVAGFAKKIKFAIDMRNETVSTNGVHVMGDFQEIAGYPNGNWQPNTTPLAQEGTTSIYSIVIELPANRKYEYRYVNGDQTYESEFIPEESRVGWDFDDNRWIFIDSTQNDTSFLPVFLFSGNAPHTKKLIRFRVSLMDAGDVDASGVHVAGSFNNWNYTGAMMYSFYRKIYEYQAYVDSNEVVNYLFANGNAVGKVETVPGACAVAGNRNVTVVNDVVTDTICIATCAVCLNNSGLASLQPKQLISTYPIPANNQVTIQFTTKDERQLELYTIRAQKVLSVTARGNTVMLNTEALPTGTYWLISRNTSSEQIETTKLLIRK